MRIRLILATAAFAAALTAPALAGPPLICHPIDTGSAASLPWQTGGGWNGMDPSYDVSHLVHDTLALLTPQTPMSARMETMRRAAIYSSREPSVAERLSSALVARTAPSRNDANALFDAGYFAEAVREAVLAYQMVHDPAQRAAWRLRSDPLSVDGRALLRRAMEAGAGTVRQTAANVLEELRGRE